MICERCNSEHLGTYGSGRFCSSKCARGFSTQDKRKEINEKVSNQLKAKHPPKNVIEKSPKPLAIFEYAGKGQHKLSLISERGHKCESCGLDTWLNKPIPLELEHVDGDNKNNVKANLKLLCPNCHSLTPTWKGRNSVRKKEHLYVPDNEFVAAIGSTPNIRQALLKLGLTPKAANYERAYNLKYSGR